MQEREDFNVVELRAIAAVIGIGAVCLLAYYLRSGLALFGLIGVGFVIERIHEPVKEPDTDK